MTTSHTLTIDDALCSYQCVLISTATDATVDVLLPVVTEPMRWRILHLLAAEELCSTHLQEMLGAKQTLVSHHMKVLREAGLVDTAPCGRFTYFRLRPGSLDSLGSAMQNLADAAHTTPTRRAC
jgi:ArsR family transcriptional regulator